MISRILSQVLLANSEEAKTRLSFFCGVHNGTIIIRFSFCDIQNIHGLGKGYQPRPSAWLLTLLVPRY